MTVPEPCGRCPSCLLAARVRELLELVDRRMVPPVTRALAELERARRAWQYQDRLRQLAAEHAARRAEWMRERDRILEAPGVADALLWCPVSRAQFSISRDAAPAPAAEETARPRDRSLEVDRDEVANRGAAWHCVRCGRAHDYDSYAPQSVCRRCFGLE